MRRVRLRTVDRMLWYVASVEHKAETLVQEHLRRMGLETGLPLLMKQYSNRTVSIRPLLPGYIFVRFNQALPNWKPMLQLPGVTGLLGVGKPMAVDTADVHRLMNIGVEVEGERVIRPSDLVEICRGKFTGFGGTVTELVDGKVRIAFSMLGKLVTHTFGLDDIRRT